MKKLGHISLIVQDIEKLKKFYQTLFDFSFDFETDDKLFVQYSLKEAENKLDLEHTSLVQVDIPNSNYKGIFLRFEVDDLEEVSKQCRELGGKVIREPIVQDYGTTEMYLEDPEGNLIQVYKQDLRR